MRKFERRNTLWLWAFSVGMAAAAPLRAETTSPAASPVTFDIWMQVSKLVQTYSDCCDRLDFERLTTIFTPDAVYDYAPGMTKTGRADIAAFLRAALVTQSHTIHFVGSPAVTPGDTPGTFSSWTQVIARHEGKNGQNHTVYGRYVDTLQPDPASGLLLIARRKVVTQIAEGTAGDRYWLDRGV